MKSIGKQLIDRTFREALLSLCVQYKILPCTMTLNIRVFEEGKMLLQLCRQGNIFREISLNDLLTAKMIGLRFSPVILEKLFKTIHIAFMKETGVENPARISLVFYQSEKAYCPCIGIMQDEKPLKVLMLSDIIQAIELESEQLN